MCYIGIDPGVSGGIVAIGDGGEVRHLAKMPDTPAGVIAVFRDIVVSCPVHPRATLEHVRSSPQMGVVSAFTFGRGLGVIEAALASFAIPYDTVTPRKWQGSMSCLSKGDKNITKRRAAQLFPAVIVTHAYADALLLAEYGRRLHRGILPQKAVRHVQEEESDPAQSPVPVNPIEQGQRLREAHREIARSAQGTAQSAAPRHGAGARRRTRPLV
jgi:crossover junction endodeoxyribonuclease RuvC